MHKFFFKYNNLTENLELSTSKSSFLNKTYIQSNSNILNKIKNDIQNLYELIVEIKENTTDNNHLTKINNTELIISNLFYSLFTSPLELLGKNTEQKNLKELYQKAITLTSELISTINIPEYSRLCQMIRNNLEDIYISLD